MPRRKVDDLVIEIERELAKGLIFEASIIGGKDHVEGLCNFVSGEITVNPAASVVDTLIHELLHRRFPGWSEKTVREETWRIIRRMSHADVGMWYRRYKRLVKRKNKPVTLLSAELRS